MNCAGLAYWLCPSLPSWLKEFDSPIPLQKIALVVKLVDTLVLEASARA